MVFGGKGIIFEPFNQEFILMQIYIVMFLGQIDYDNYGISGVEKYFDKQLKSNELIKQPLRLTLDTNIQFIVNDELNKALKIFDATGGAALLMNSRNGEVLSLVSLPNFNINIRKNIVDKNYINKITKGVYELGSIFKTFTVAIALENKIVSPDTIIKNIPQSIKCSVHEIADIKKHPKRFICCRCSYKIFKCRFYKTCKKIGQEKYKKFFEKTNLLNTSQFEVEEVEVLLNEME